MQMSSMHQASNEALAALTVLPDEDIEAIERRERNEAASTIRERLPAFVRTAPAHELAARVVPVLRKPVAGWSPDVGSLLILGPTRCGKSSASGFAFRRLLHAGVMFGGDAWRRAQGLHWYPATELEEARRQHPLGKGDAPEIIAASYAALLVIDDAGWDRDQAAVSHVIAARYENCLPTLVTSALTQFQLTTHYGAAVVRKLCEAGGGRATIANAHGSRK